MKNVELKARLSSAKFVALLAQLRVRYGETILKQIDTFFHCKNGRLKLRVLGPLLGQLIHYEREDNEGLKLSNYQIAETKTPDDLCQVMTQALGVRGQVIKQRHLFMIGQTRVHMDNVQDLGYFIELETVLGPNQTVEEGHKVAQVIMDELDVKDDFVAEAYIDLISKE